MGNPVLPPPVGQRNGGEVPGARSIPLLAGAAGGQMVMRLMAGSRARRSPASEVMTGWPARRAQMTTWASAMSEVPLAARRRPVLVASTWSRLTRSVAGWRIRRARRAWRSGRRIAWASTVAGIVTAAPVSRARASRTRTRRSPRSMAISAPASKVTPGIRRRTCRAGGDAEDSVGPGPFVVGHRAAGLPQRFGEHRPPAGHIVKRHGDGMLDEPGYARG